MISAAQKIFFAHRQAVGAMFALLAAIGFSAKAVLVKLAYVEAVDAVTLLALRMAFSAPFFLVAAYFSGRGQHVVPLTTRDMLMLAGLGLLGYYLASLLDFIGLQYISAGLERLILFLYPTLVVMLGALLLKQKVGYTSMIASLISYAGIFLVFLHDMGGMERQDVLAGSLLVFGSALSYALFLVGAGRTIDRLGSTRFTAYVMMVSCIACLLHFSVTHPVAGLRQPVSVYLLALTMALISTVLPAFLLTAALRRIGPMHTSLIGSIGPISTIFLAYVLLGEQLSVIQLAGSILVLAGVLTISRNKNH